MGGDYSTHGYLLKRLFFETAGRKIFDTKAQVCLCGRPGKTPIFALKGPGIGARKNGSLETALKKG